MKTTRREFIKISSLGAGSLALATPSLSWLGGNEEPMDDTQAKRYANYCEVCFWNCAGWAYTNKEGKLWKIIGNDVDQHSMGRFCPRGTGGIGAYYDSDRLKTPLIRVEVDGKQTYKEATWDEALDLVAKRLMEVKRKHGASSVALFNHGNSGKHMSHLLRAFGTTNMGSPANAQCKTPREIAFGATFGHELHSPEPLDIRDTRCLVLIGSHLGENMHNGQVQEMSEAIDKGATIITVDPRFSTAASKSKFWLPIKPATDIALLLAWMNVLINNEWYNKKYVEKYTYGFDQLKAYVQPFTPEWAFGETGIEPQNIIATAREMANAAPAVIVHPGRHTAWYGDDTQRLRAVAILNALLGSWGARGGFYHPAQAKVPKFQTPEYPAVEWGWKVLSEGKYRMANAGITNVLVDASHPEWKNEKKIKAWMVIGSNLMATIPNPAYTLEAIQNLDFMVVVDTMPADITGYADVVLPECTYLERYDDLRVSEHRQPNIALRVPAAEPMYESKPAWWMAKELSKRMGLGAFFPWNDYAEVLDFQLKKLGTSLEEFKNVGVMNLERPYEDLYFAEDEEAEFETNTGKIELYSTAFEEEGYPPLPVYTKHAQPPEGYYRLIYGRAPMHTFSRTNNNPLLTDLMDENDLWVNPKVANEWGLKNGQYLWLQNHHGVISDFPIKVRVTERIRWDSVYMVHGFGSTNKKLTRAFGRGISDTQMISEIMLDSETGSTGMRGNFVTFITEDPRKEVVS